MTFQEIDHTEWLRRMEDAGYSEEEAEDKWREIQEDEEADY